MGLISGVALPLAHQQAGTDGGHTKTMSFLTKIVQRWTGSIQRLWLASQLLYAACMFAAFFATSLAFVCILVGVCGISWAVTIWAPWTIIGVHVSYDLDDSESSLSLMHEYGRPEEEEDCSELSVEPKTFSRQQGGRDNCERRPGIVFGLHNAFIAGPQILAAVVCSFIFWAVEGTRYDGVGWGMVFGGLAALGAAFLATGLEEDRKVGI